MKTQKTVLFHVDIDSPAVLEKFWSLPDSGTPAGPFYELAMNRALAFFGEMNVPATFFCVGRELGQCADAREAVRRAHLAGHEIANHSFSHFYEPSRLGDDALREDIRRCSEAIRQVTGRDPAGFRAPGYAIGERLIGILRGLAFSYDSSAFWSPVTALMKLAHRSRSKASFRDSYGETTASVPSRPYFPAPGDWKREGSDRGLLEIPLPRSPWGLTPFYNNFHLTVPDFWRAADLRGVRGDCVVYLFHLIEFCDLGDGLPRALRIHPNLSTPVAAKLKRMRDSVRRLMSRRRVERTDRYAEAFRTRTGA